MIQEISDRKKHMQDVGKFSNRRQDEGVNINNDISVEMNSFTSHPTPSSKNSSQTNFSLQNPQILVPIQKDVAQLVVQLDEERSIRQSKEQEYRKNLQDSVDLIEKNLDIEKFNREQQ